MSTQIYKLPDSTFDSVATRFSLPVRCLAYSPSGTNLAAAGDDEGIKLISAAESKVQLSVGCNVSEQLVQACTIVRVYTRHMSVNSGLAL